eukprot:Nk52_evm7s335 gene=Nk52_evmTU7s335
MSDRDSYDEEEDEDYEEEDEMQPRKKARGGASDFVLDEAEVSDDEEEDDYDDEEAELEEAEAEELGAESGGKHRELNSMFSKNNDDDAAVDYFTKKYGQDAMREEEDNDFNAYNEPEAIKQQSLLPSVRDPKLWLVKCQIGRERAAVFALMRKYIEKESAGTPLQVKSFSAPQHVKGYIYVEAHKQSHVKAAIQGLQVLSLGQWKQDIVPIREMPEVFAVNKKVVTLEPNSWVRVKRGVYKEDVGQVVSMEETGNTATIKLVPRIDFDNIKRMGNPGEKRKKGKGRPAQKMFNVAEIRALDGDVTRIDGIYDFYDNNRYKDGYLFKAFPLNALICEGVKPSIDELQRFQNSAEGDMDMAGSLGAGTGQVVYTKGDSVEVVEGELTNLTGIVEKVDGETITVLPKHEDLQELGDALQFQRRQLRKFFKMGDHVKVINGLHNGETGLVVRIDDGVVIFFSDVALKEVKVFSKDLQLTTEVASGVDSLGQYELHDLVQLDAHSVACIVKVEKDTFKALDQHGNVKTVRLQEIVRKKNSKFAASMDRDHNNIQVDDVVSVADGPHKGRQGQVKHMYRSFVFLYSRDMVENSGIFVCRNRNLQVVGGKGGRKIVPSEGSGMGHKPFVPASPRLSSPAHPSQGGPMQAPQRMGAPGLGRGRGRNRDDRLLSQTVTITGGPYKGYIGIVKDATETTARVELHTKSKTITVDRTKLNFTENQGRNGGGDRGGGSFQRGDFGGSASRTPMHGGQTPMHGARTPMYGSETPMHDGSATPRHGAWDTDNAPTPGSDFRTPGGDYPMSYNEYDSGQTPGNFSTPNPNTPGVYDPSTPGAYPGTPAMYNQPTPGAGLGNPQTPISYNPETPGGGMNPSTPGFQPATPGGYNIETPQAYGSYSDPYAAPTPGGIVPKTPGTPGVFGGPSQYDGRSQEQWQTVGIEVKILGGAHAESAGCIEQVNGGECEVEVLPKGSGRIVTVNSDDLQKVVPVKNDQVKLIHGDNKGEVGKLVGIDGSDGIVRLTKTLDLKILNMDYVAKLSV